MKKTGMKKGSGLVEVIVSSAIILIVMLGLYTTHTYFISLTHSNTKKVKANLLLEEGVEAVKTMRDRSWVNISGLTPEQDYYLVFSGGVWATSTTSVAVDGVFYRKFRTSDVSREAGGDIDTNGGGTADSGTKKITVDVSWWNQNATSTASITTYVANIL